MNARETISRIMAIMPVTARKWQLSIAIGLAKPSGLTKEQEKEWREEHQKAIDEWNADLPSLSSEPPVSCQGGPLVASPISTAKPEPLPSEKLIQQNLL